MMKVNARYEFPEVFDAAPFLSEDADKSEPWVYQKQIQRKGSFLGEVGRRAVSKSLVLLTESKVIARSR